MNKNKKAGLIVLLIVIIGALFCAFVNISSLSPNKKGNIKPKGSRHGEYIAALYIEGTIQEENNTYNQEWLLDTIASLKQDQNNKAIAIFMNSPGGSVYEADEAYLALQDYRTSGKPVYVYQGQMAASGGYYISCAGEKIYANRNTLTGSIGVIFGKSIDITGLLNNLGIKSETIHSGTNKNMFSFDEPVTAEQRKIMQSIADECYEQFVGIVANSRKMPVSKVKELADGRIYTANQALKNGLIDGISSWDDMLTTLKDDKFDGKNIKVVEYSYERNKNFREILFGKSNQKEPVSSILDEISSESKIRYPAYLYK